MEKDEPGDQKETTDDAQKNPYCFSPLDAKVNVYWQPRMKKWKGRTPRPAGVPENPKVGHLKFAIKQTREYSKLINDGKINPELIVLPNSRSNYFSLPDSTFITEDLGGFTRCNPLQVKGKPQTSSSTKKRKREDWKKKYEEKAKECERLKQIIFQNTTEDDIQL